jgi:hypothetical protein
MPIVTDLPELAGRISATQELLARSPDSDGVQRAVNQLATVDDMLASLIGAESVPPGMAVCLGRVRDDLSSHVCAALHLDQVAPPDRSVALLQRGVASANAGIHAITQVGHTG